MTRPSYHHSHSHSHSHHSHPPHTRRLAVLPLHRSITDEHAYIDKPSPITRFARKLLGIPVLSRTHVAHKSRSTTFITKSSVMSSVVQYNTEVWNDNIDTAKGERTTSVHRDADEDDQSSTSSEQSGHTLHAVASMPSVKRAAAASLAMDALQAASLIPTRSSMIQFDSPSYPLPPLELCGRDNDTLPVLNQFIAEQLRPYLPRRYRILSHWSMAYSLDRHGASLSTLYHCMKNTTGPCLLAIKDEQGHVFGAFLNEPLYASVGYYGTGECFLWKFPSHPILEADEPNVRQEHASPTLKVFPWTGKNEYMILSTLDYIAVGGGNGRFGLWLDHLLEHGYSDVCLTFDNEPLPPQNKFSIIGLELWAFST